jgi:hypothetical protein
MKKILLLLLALTIMPCVKTMASDAFEDFQAVIENPEISPYYNVSRTEAENIVYDLITKYQKEYKKQVLLRHSNCASMPKQALRDTLRSKATNLYNVAMSFSDIRTYRTWIHVFVYLPFRYPIDIKGELEWVEKCGVKILQSTDKIDDLIRMVLDNYVIGTYTTEEEKTKTVGFIAALNYGISQMPFIKNERQIYEVVGQVARNYGIAVDRNDIPVVDAIPVD